jgi:hypothetical protein
MTMTLNQVRREYTFTRLSFGEWRVGMRVNNQYFLFEYRSTSKREAAWYRTMLATALKAMLDKGDS